MAVHGCASGLSGHMMTIEAVFQPMLNQILESSALRVGTAYRRVLLRDRRQSLVGRDDEPLPLFLAKLFRLWKTESQTCLKELVHVSMLLK